MYFRAIRDWAVIVSFFALSGCAPRKSVNLIETLKSEISFYGGKANAFDNAVLPADLQIKRDSGGARIDAKNVSYNEVTNILTRAYGEPILYVRAGQWNGDIYLYTIRQAGINVSVENARGDVQIVIFKELK